MKFTLAWLKDHLETEATLDEIAATLTARSAWKSTDVVRTRRRSLGAVHDRPGRRRQATPGRRSSLSVCARSKLTPGEAPVEVVCGAPNARTGLVGVFAPLGTYIPGTGSYTRKAPGSRRRTRTACCVSERELETLRRPRGHHRPGCRASPNVSANATSTSWA